MEETKADQMHDVEFDATGGKLEIQASGDAGDTMKTDEADSGPTPVVKSVTNAAMATHHYIPDVKMPSIPQSSLSEENVDPDAIVIARNLKFFITDAKAKQFFCQRPGLLDDAISVCQKRVISDNASVIGTWLLACIDHWDHEHERLIILTPSDLFICSYDFIALKVKEYQQIPLQILHTLEIGELVYPPKSLMPSRACGGVRLLWKGEEPGFFGRWNPVNKTVPKLIITHHPLMYNNTHSKNPCYSASDFVTKLTAHMRSLEPPQRDASYQVTQQPIMIESWMSVTSAPYNQSLVGYNLERNGVSF